MPFVETVSFVPVVQAPASSLYWVLAKPPLMPEPPLSLAASVTVTGVLCQLASVPEAVVVGAVVSRKMSSESPSTWPTASRYSASIVLVPSPAGKVHDLLAAYDSHDDHVPPLSRKRICVAPVTAESMVTE